MATISKKLVGFLYSGAAQSLASASFKGNVNSIIGLDAAGTGYTSFNPANTFNSLTQLVPDGVYIVDSKLTGYELPGAVLTTGGSSGGGPVTAPQEP